MPPTHEEPFSTPRSWHMLSDTLHSYGDLSEELGQRRFKVFPALPFVATMDSSGFRISRPET